jgi:ATP-dependent RNA helicase RhlE
MGFLPTIRKIKTFLPKQRQTLLFTATMPKEIQHLAKELVSNPKTIRVGTSGLSTTVAHNMFAVTDAQKNGLLLKVVEDLGSGSAIVFTRTKRRAKKLGEMLQEAGKSAVSLQGNLSQNKRRNAIDGFRNGQYRVLVATDIAARGIDVSQVSHVVNFDMPNTVEAYTHRTGRTGRANRLGDALSFTTDVDRQILRKIQTQLKLDIGELPIPKNLPKVAAARSSSPRTAREQSSTTRNNNPLQSRRPSKSKSRHYSKTRRAYDS